MKPAKAWKAAAALTAALVAMVPVLSRSDVVRLKDGTTLKGRVVSLVADTLTVRTTFGADVRVERSKVSLVSFTDSLVAAAPAPSTPAAPGAPVSSAPGKIGVTFLDRELSTKISAPSRGDRDAYLAANAIEQTLIVDDQVVYTRRDTTMDKTIYNGPERVYKNEIKLEDFEVTLVPGFHHAQLIIRNVGADDFAEAFDPEPLNLLLNLDNLEVPSGKTLRVKVGISRGKLRMSQPRLFRAE